MQLTNNFASPTINGMRRKKLLTIILAGVIALLIAIIGVLVWKYQQVKSDPGKEAKKTSLRIIDKVANLYMVPSNEEPTVALIQDKSKLGNQEFFKNAKNGDYLLIYQKEKVALVYREDADKLVNVGPVNIGADQNGQTAGAQTDSKAP
jgi:hypothetical protein